MTTKVEPLVSIVIPCYNAVDYIQATVESCLSQTHKNIEIIIQDDKSTDGTAELIQGLYSQTDKISICQNQKNLGIGGNWNAAYKRANGDYLIIFNADDLLHPNIVRHFLSIFDTQKDLNIVTGKFEVLITETGETFLYPDHTVLTNGPVFELFEQLFFKSAFHWNYSLIDKKFLKNIEFEDGNLFINTQICDYELWYRAYLANAKVYFDNSNVWGLYRKHATNISSRPNGELRSFLKDFLAMHQQSLKKEAGFRYTKKMLRRFVTFCANTKHFEKDVFFLYINRIAQSIL